MRKLRRHGWLILTLSWLLPARAAELKAPPKTEVTETAASPKAEAPPSDAPVNTETSEPVSSKTSKDAGGSESRLVQPDTELIDEQTASITDYGSFSSRTRFFTGGGVVEWINFGVFQRLNVGASLNVDKFVGSASPVQITRPDLQVKFRFYDGTSVLPALAVGFDDQGYLYNRVDQRYNQRDRGLYLVGSQEVIVPGLLVNAGINIPDFNNNPLFGFIGTSYNIQDIVLLMAEWDNINDFADSRLNTGFRVYITPNVSADFAVRGVGQGGHYSDGTSRGPERVVMLKYTGNF